MVGAKQDGGYLPSPSFYWAEYDGATYTEHYDNIGVYNANAYATLEIYKSTVSSSQTNILVNGNLVGISTSFAGRAFELQAGNETTSSTVHTYGSMGALKWRDLQGGWHGGWQTGSRNSSLLTPDAPLYSNWVDTYVSFRSGAGATC